MRDDRARPSASPERAPEDAGVIVDALFGSGFHGRLEGAAESLVRRVNALDAPIVALDVPSGVDGASWPSRRHRRSAAELTLALHGRTVGTAIEPGRGCCGHVVELPIGLPGALAGPARALRLDPSDLASRPPAHGRHEVRRGRRAVVGGSPGMSGAPALAALSALPRRRRRRLGLRARERARRGRRARPGADGARRARAGARARARGPCAGAVVAGPGLGRAREAAELIDALVRRVEAPLVLDADALFALAVGSRAERARRPHRTHAARRRARAIARA